MLMLVSRAIQEAVDQREAAAWADRADGAAAWADRADGAAAWADQT
jgi:hypothetical protein